MAVLLSTGGGRSPDTPAVIVFQTQALQPDAHASGTGRLISPSAADVLRRFAK